MAKNRPVGERSATASAPSRLPSTRERRPALAALAVLLIVGGALGSGWLALRAGDRVPYLQVTQEVAQGQRIDEDDLTTVRLPRGFDGLETDRRDDVLNSYARTRLFPDTVLSPAMLSREGGIEPGTVQVAVVTTAAQAGTLENGSAVALTVESAEDGTPTTAIGEVVRVGTGDGGASGDDPDEDVVIQVAVGSRCLQPISSGLTSGDVQIALLGNVDESGLEQACRVG